MIALVLLCLVHGALASSDAVNVTCGSLIKLRNAQTLRHLHSFEINYGSGSGQQAVVGTLDGDSGESHWIVQDAGSEDYASPTGRCQQGTPLQNGSKVRLQHARTGKFLHSHLFQSPISQNQEVSCFGSPSQSDTGDIWLVEWEGKDTRWWERDMQVRMKHADTGAFLGSHTKEYGRPIAGYAEIYAAKGKGKGKQHVFMATDGVYFS